jgi:hypothetical protein
MSEHDPADAKPDDKEGFAADAKNVAVDTLKRCENRRPGGCRCRRDQGTAEK